MNTFKTLWGKFSKNKAYREEFVAAQVKRGIPFQIRALIKHQGITQEVLAQRAGLKQGVVSRAANPEYGNLTLNTLIRIAAGFDVAFVGKFVPFSELGRWFTQLSEESAKIKNFNEEQLASGPANERPLQARTKRRTHHRNITNITPKPRDSAVKKRPPGSALANGNQMLIRQVYSGNQSSASFAQKGQIYGSN